MGNDLELILDRCLEALARGQTVEECLATYPEVADELAPLLAVAVEFGALPRPEPRREAIHAALVRVGASLPRPRARGAALLPGRFRLPWLRPVFLGVARWATALAVSLVVAVGIGAASARSVPGDLLYPLKLVTERVTFALTASPEGRAELRLVFADRRLGELLRGAQRRGRVDPELLRQVLREAELALEDARPLPEGRFPLVLAKVEAFNIYQKAALRQLQAGAQGEDTELIRRAISVCEERARWMRKMMTSPEGEWGRTRRWGPGCQWE
ncbi:MAG: hypothetical protein KatS3mg007_1858 [Thermoanaerobaculum sp.]|nr:MAG: hypothetical protein KatS3mg007_1858 [Thermoanaerobaculum sp.]